MDEQPYCLGLATNGYLCCAGLCRWELEGHLAEPAHDLIEHFDMQGKGHQRWNAQQCCYPAHTLPRLSTTRRFADAVLVMDLHPPHLRWRLNRRRQAYLLRMRKRAWSHRLIVPFLHVSVNGHAVVWRQSCIELHSVRVNHARTHEIKLTN
jgi:hypothetical protein